MRRHYYLAHFANTLCVGSDAHKGVAHRRNVTALSIIARTLSVTMYLWLRFFLVRSRAVSLVIYCKMNDHETCVRAQAQQETASHEVALRIDATTKQQQN
jgi:hypothetical protein